MTKPPANLGAEGVALWRRLQADYAIDDGAGIALLRIVCEARSRVAEARAAVKRDGAFVADRFGQLRPHPALAIERDSRSAMISGLRALRLAPGAAE